MSIMASVRDWFARLKRRFKSPTTPSMTPTWGMENCEEEHDASFNYVADRLEQHAYFGAYDGMPSRAPAVDRGTPVRPRDYGGPVSIGPDDGPGSLVDLLLAPAQLGWAGEDAGDVSPHLPAPSAAEVCAAAFEPQPQQELVAESPCQPDAGPSDWAQSADAGGVSSDTSSPDVSSGS